MLCVKNPENPAQTVTLFYGRQPVLSNFYICPFKIGKLKFNSTEMFFQQRKALFFEDYKMADKIMRAKSPGQQKKLGRLVKGYNEERWTRVRTQTMESGCIAKFTQNQHAKEVLLATGDSKLAECSLTDRVWGVGLRLNDPKASNPKNWCGQNLMGSVLENVRAIIAEKDA